MHPTSRPNRQYTDFEPKCDWTDDGPTHTLRVHIPGFRKEYLKVQIDGGGNLKVTGERPLQPLGDNRWSRFRKVFRVPDNTSPAQIKARFENAVLFVRVPKAAEPGPVTQPHHVSHDTSSSRTSKEKEERKGMHDSDTTTTDDHEEEEEEDEEEEEELPSFPGRDKRSLGIARRFSESFRSSGWQKLGLGWTPEKRRRTVVKLAAVFVALLIGLGVGFYCIKPRGNNY